MVSRPPRATDETPETAVLLDPPPEFEVRRELSCRPGERVLLARRGAENAVLRLESGGGPGGAVAAELCVLAAVRHPGLASLLAFGELDGGGRYVAREWVPGEELGTWARGREPEELGRLAVHLAGALDHLHRRGFVHGDLKPANVIVRPGGEPVLCDFGLSSARSVTPGAAGGTLFAVAPERLAGAPPEPPADLFALGVLLHQLTTGQRASAREFYARFPAEPFLKAAGTPIETLPPWSRDLIEALVSRDPGRRPDSAQRVAQVLASRLNEPCAPAPVQLELPVTLGRGEDLARLLGALAGDAQRAWWYRLPDAEEVEPFARALRVAAALERVPVKELDLAAALHGVDDAAALDRWACETAAAGALVLGAPELDAWQARAIQSIARVGTAPLVVISAAEPVEDCVAWRERAARPLDAADLVPYLGQRFEPADSHRAGELARALAAEAGGSTARAGHLLGELLRQGWILEGDERLRLRQGELPALSAAQAGEDLGESPLLDLPVLSALAVVPGGELGELARIAELEPVEAARQLLEAQAGGLAGRVGPDRFALAPPAFEALILRSPAARWRALHLRCAGVLAQIHRSSCEVLLHRVCAGVEGAWRELRQELGRRLDSGGAELALGILDRLETWKPLGSLPPREERVAQRALAWCAAGLPKRAAEELERAPEAASPQGEADLERARGRVASLLQRPEEALEHLERAAEIDPGSRSESLVARLHLMYSVGRDEEVLELHERLESSGELGGWGPGNRTNARSIAALSRLRRGEVEAARAALEELLSEPELEPANEAAVRLNLATIERRAGAPARAVEHLERAEEISDASGHLEGLAQTRATLGGVLRELGELLRAEPYLVAALGIRERLGNRTGAAVVRGVLGLLHAERGHVRAAITELEAAAAAMGGAQARRYAPLLEGRAEELRARLGEAPDDGRSVPEAAIDPRVFLAWARVGLLRGDRQRARKALERARAAAGSLELRPVVEEAAFLDAVLEGAPPPTGALSVAVREDAELLHQLIELRAGGGREAARELARSLLSRGRDDRAARLLFALARLGGEPAEVEDQLESASEALARCSQGLTPGEALALRAALLGIPDPEPDDLEIVSETKEKPEEFEMEVLTLLDINHRLVQQQDLQTLLGVIVESALSVTGAERGFLMLEQDGELVFDTAQHSTRGGIAEPELEVSHSIVRRALEQMRPLRLSNATDDPLLMHAPSVTSLDLRSVLCAPFQAADDLRGVIYVDHRLHSAAFGERAQRLLELLADQAALAIRQVRRVQEIRELNQRLGETVVQQESDLKAARRSLREVGLPGPVGGLVGSSPAMRRVHALLERAAPTQLPVLLRGASGTGKELAARALHEHSLRAGGPFVTENCAALPESLIESELFGYTRGAFTGAEADREGLFERASGGTLFLDEIGEMPLNLQVKLLRVLEMREVRRLGEARSRPVDFRLVVATNRDLSAEVREGRFREDLFYRLAGLVVEMPTLAERPEDIPELVDHFLRLQSAAGEAPRRISKAVLRQLLQRAWPGNVRELRNEVERLAVLSQGDIEDPALVSLPGPMQRAARDGGALCSLADLERRAIVETIEQLGGDKRAAAGVLGISLAKIYQRLKQWRIEGDAGAS